MNMTGTTRAYQTCDVDEQAMLLRGWNQTYHQLSAGSFTGTLIEVDLGGVRIMHEYTSRALRQTGMLSESQIALGLLVASPARPFFCGSLCDEDKAIIFSGSDAFEFHSPGGVEILDFVIERNALRERLGDEEFHALSMRLRTPRLHALCCGHRLQLQQRARGILSLSRGLHVSPDEAHAPRHQPAWQAPSPQGRLGVPDTAAMREELLDTLIHALQGNDGNDGVNTRPTHVQQTRIVEAARALMQDCTAGTSPSIHDICQQLGVARRTLQNAFQQTLGTSPHRYLRALRLNRARQAIKQQQRVADAATAWGFWHFGRFSRDYRQLFGELPSETMQRARRS